ncbi:hypothetical protein C3V43_12110 [Bacteroides heparinolyticus]|nr:hypothetical protein C3V43_09270 [Bacteroides heparinolyticus]AVM58407.1 hypothetical protein C3V43_12110 [Bacteroides heparinolyticus]
MTLKGYTSFSSCLPSCTERGRKPDGISRKSRGQGGQGKPPLTKRWGKEGGRGHGRDFPGRIPYGGDTLPGGCRGEMAGDANVRVNNIYKIFVLKLVNMG